MEQHYQLISIHSGEELIRMIWVSFGHAVESLGERLQKLAASRLETLYLLMFFSCRRSR